MVTASSSFMQQAVRLHRAGRLDRAVQFYRRALREDPALSEAEHALGDIAFQQEDYFRAVERYQAAADLQPDVFLYLYDLANAWRKLGRKSEAVHAYLQAADLDRQSFDALFHLGMLLCELVRPAEGARALRLAIKLRPDHAEARLTLGLCLERLGQLDAAVEQYMAALRLRPAEARGYLLLGGALFKTGHVAEADLAFGRALNLNPSLAGTDSRRIAALNYRADVSTREVAAAHREWGRRCAAGLRTAGAGRRHPNPRDPERRLRVGYVSPNFFQHSVAHFLLPVLRAHNHRQVEVFCYANSVMEDETTRALRAASEHWHVIVGRSDEDVAAQVRADGIDILVDLAGHTGDGRLLTFARKPAPVQVAWLGYPQTTGLETMDYRLSDAIVEPPGEADELSTETIVRMPHGFLCFGRPGEDGPGDGCDGGAPEIGPLPAEASGYVTFGSFNTVQKISPQLVALWSRVLGAVDGSRLVLKSLPDAVIADRYRAMFAAHGIDPARIEFLQWAATRPGHLRLYDRMDIALDTFPYHGTTTTCEAMWMGVPVLSLCGDAHVSRVGASLLTRVGLEDWIVSTEDAYVERAVSGAADLPRLGQIRVSLRRQMRGAALCDAGQFTRDLETAFRTMWRAFCQ